jgi:hypothetical protein
MRALEDGHFTGRYFAHTRFALGERKGDAALRLRIG